MGKQEEKQKAERKKQKAESRKQKVESRKKKVGTMLNPFIFPTQFSNGIA